MKKGFTLVELIIVIAVIGVLAAILIPTFSNVIEKANRKSAFSDAKNSLSIYIAEKSDGTGAQLVGDGSIFKVKKANKDWYFVYKMNGLHDVTEAVADGGLGVNEANIHDAVAPTGSYTTVTKTDIDQLPSNVTIMVVPAN